LITSIAVRESFLNRPKKLAEAQFKHHLSLMLCTTVKADITPKYSTDESNVAKRTEKPLSTRPIDLIITLQPVTAITTAEVLGELK
jgi:hypothetical protein